MEGNWEIYGKEMNSNRKYLESMEERWQTDIQLLSKQAHIHQCSIKRNSEKIII